MTVLAAVLLGLMALVWASVPLIRRDEEPVPEVERDQVQARLSERRDTMYDNIRDLDFERAMGKLTAEDHRDIRQGMVQEAAAVLKELELVSRDQALDRWIEEELAERRRGGAAAAAAAPVACPSCRRPSPAGARFCDGCGQALARPTCTACGAPLRAEARFCNDCGARR